MRASAVRLVAASWLFDEFLPSVDPQGFLGAYVMGSLASLSDDDEFDTQARDVDVAVVVDPDRVPIDHDRYPHGRFVVHDGCALQAIFLSREVFETEEKLLGMLGLGSNLRHGRVIADPAGLVTAAQTTVAERWHQPRWIRHRLDRAIGFAEGGAGQLEEQSAGPGRLMALTEVITQLAGLVAISQAVTPTHRRALVLAQQLLVEMGRPDLHADLLAAIGAIDADEDAVDAAIDDGLEALQVELRYPAPPDLSPAFRGRMSTMFVAGVRAVVDEGYTREAMLPAITGPALSAMAIGDRADPDDRRQLDDLLQRRLVSAGIRDDGDWQRRTEDTRSLMRDISTLCATTVGP